MALLGRVPDGRGWLHWLEALSIYLANTVAAHLIWEVLQLPLYTIWSTEIQRVIVFSIVLCTTGDLIIATLSLVVAPFCFGGPAWPTADIRGGDET